MKNVFIIVFFLSAITATAQMQVIDLMPVNGLLLDKGWKFNPGDSAGWAKKDWNDSKWATVQLTDYNSYLSQFKERNIGWFRLHLKIDLPAQKKPLAIQLSQLGTSEVYLNGQFFQRFGSIKNGLNNETVNPVSKPFLLPYNIGDSAVIAIRFASHVPSSKLWLFIKPHTPPLTVTVNSWDNALLTYRDKAEHAETETKFSYLFVALSFLFIMLYIFFPREKINLLFGIFCFFAVTRSYLVFHLSQGSLDITNFGFISYFLDLNDAILGSLQISIICYAVLNKIPFYCRMLILGIGIDLILLFVSGPTHFQLIFDFIFRVLTVTGFFYLSILAFRKKIYTIGIVAFISSLLNVTFFLFLFDINAGNLNPFTANDYVRYALTINFIMTTLYVARNFARKSKNLEVQLVEIENLSKDNLRKEKEKQLLLASQNETLERQVSQRTSELKQSFEDLKSTQAQLIQSEKMASLGELTAGIAHEIQNPLNFVNNFSELNRELIEELKNQKSTLKSEELDEILNDIDTNLEKINHHGKRAEAIVKGMLQHSRKNTGVKELTDINALCDEYLRLSYHGLRAKEKNFNADFKTDFDETIGNINIVPQDIGRVLLNLFNNAFYAVSKPPSSKGLEYKPLVSVQTKWLNNSPSGDGGVGKGSMEIIVADNGNGIPQNIIDKIFQPFFTTKPTGQGTGLGLSLSYDIIKAHGGEIKVETKEGGGTEFIIQLLV